MAAATPLRAHAQVVLLLLLASGCSRREPELFEPPRPMHRLPARSGPLRAFRVTEGSRVAVELPAREATPRGALTKVTGALRLDIHDLRRMEGEIRADLEGLQMDAAGGPFDTQAALRWLELGSDVAVAQKATHRWATLKILSAEDLSAESAWQGKPSGETRTVSGALRGSLELHGVRIDQRIEVELKFHYHPQAATSHDDAVPYRVELTTRKGLSLPLDHYKVGPRDARGATVSAELQQLGRVVGRVAHVQGTLTANLIAPEDVAPAAR